MILTVDIGNSRIKWALWQAGEIVVRAAAFYEADRVKEAFDQLLVDISKVSQDQYSKGQPSTGYLYGEKLLQVCAVCVVGDVIKSALTAWVRQYWHIDVVYLETQKQYKNIIHAYDDPSQHGVDRWAGIIAACQKNSDGSICVIGAGTAITFDLIKRVELKKGIIKSHEERSRYCYQHLGGYILPSFISMHDALSKDTVKASSVANPEYVKKGVPVNTHDAINQGLHLLLQAGIREICKSAEEQLGESVQIIITGGSARAILRYSNLPAMKYEPDLVMEGVYEMIKQKTQLQAINRLKGKKKKGRQKKIKAGL